MNRRRAVGALVLLLILTACRGDPAAGVPALLVDPDTRTRAELQRVIAEALHDADVTLSDEALVRDSVLIVERQRRVGPDGTRIAGRELQPPTRFELIREGRDCILLQPDTGRRWPLRGADCKPAPEGG